jgi:hypothetical protein
LTINNEMVVFLTVEGCNGLTKEIEERWWWFGSLKTKCFFIRTNNWEAKCWSITTRT